MLVLVLAVAKATNILSYKDILVFTEHLLCARHTLMYCICLYLLPYDILRAKCSP